MDLWGKRNEKSECSTALTVNLDLTREPWRCANCQKFMYNLDSKGRPAPGAPAPLWGGPDHKEVCHLCFEMKSVLDSRAYWLNLHKEWMEQRKGGNKLKPGGDYFAS